MTSDRCVCACCRSWRLAVRISFAALAAMILAGVLSLPAKADTIVACVKFQLPGKEHTLNPHTPPAKQRQETARLCQEISVPDMKPRGRPMIVTDDRRTIA